MAHRKVSAASFHPQFSDLRVDREFRLRFNIVDLIALF